MESAILVALVVGGLSVLGTFISSKYTANVRVVKLEMQVDTLKIEVTKHNKMIERTYELEKRVSITEHDIKNIEQSSCLI